jgi:penicillin-binding protein 1A
MTRSQRKQRRGRSRGSGKMSKVLLGLAVIAVVMVLGALSAVGYVVGIAASAPEITSLQPVESPSSSEVLSASGKRLGFIQFNDLRTPLEADRIPELVRQATVAIEDRRFYKHRGVDYEGIVRAAFENLRSGKTVQGGSTITMQLVRNLYISKERTFKRKVREAKLASELEEQRSKSWILNKYLNTVPYGTVGGQTAIGIGAGARVFFGKRAQDLKLHEVALLAGLPQAPSDYNPFQNPAAALSRRNDVLEQMERSGYITQEQAERAMRRKLGVKHGTYYTARRESYFFDYVKQLLIDRYGLPTVQQGGMKIHTTIDLDLQKAARSAIANRLNFANAPRSAVVTLDPRTGYIRAMASSATYKQSNFNLAAQGQRQPGSTFKVMVLMDALRRGVDPDRTSYVSDRLNIPAGQPWGPWDVKTYSGTPGGGMNIHRATLKSDNIIYAKLALDLGPETVKKTARDMGITSKLNGYPAEALGGLERGVSPLEMARAYASIANGGERVKPIAITKVEHPDGKVDELGKPKKTKVFSDGVTSKATQILKDNMTQGTGTAAQIGCPAAGKTGTTDKNTDAWFVGFTPRLTTAVWVGYPNSTRIQMNNLHNGGPVDGGTFPAEIWGDYMKVAKGGFCGDFEQPTEPFQPQPFFGKYSATGTRSDNNYDYTDPNGTQTTPGTTTPDTGKKDNGNGDKAYDPNMYETQPQGSPDAGPGNGNGNGNGNNGGAGAPGR